MLKPVQKTAEVEGKTVKVTGESLKSDDEELCKYYFENTKRSGGGETSCVMWDDKRKCFFITFLESTVAERVISREHSLNNCQIQVELCQPPPLPRNRGAQPSSTSEWHSLLPTTACLKVTVTASAACQKITGTPTAACHKAVAIPTDACHEDTVTPTDACHEDTVTPTDACHKDSVTPADACHTDKFIIFGVPESTTHDCLRDYLEVATDVFVECLSMEGNHWLAVLDSSDEEIDIQKMNRLCRETPLATDIELTIKGIPKQNTKLTIYVSGLKPTTADETIKFFFSNKRRNNGGPVKKVERLPDKSKALVHFEKHEDAENIVKKGEFTLENNKLHVALYHGTDIEERQETAKSASLQENMHTGPASPKREVERELGAETCNRILHSFELLNTLKVKLKLKTDHIIISCIQEVPTRDWEKSVHETIDKFLRMLPLKTPSERIPSRQEHPNPKPVPPKRELERKLGAEICKRILQNSQLLNTLVMDLKSVNARPQLKTDHIIISCLQEVPTRDWEKDVHETIDRFLRRLPPVIPPRMTEHNSQSESMVEASPQCDRPNGKARHSADPVEQSETGYDSYGQESKMTVIPPSSRGSSAGDRNFESSSSKNITTQQNEKVWKNKFDLELKTPDTASATAYSDAEMVHPPARIQEDTIPNLKACQQRVLSNPVVMEHLCKDFEELEIFVDEEQRIVKLRAPEGIFLRSKNRVLTFITNVRERRIQLTPVQVKMYQQEDVVKWIQVTVIDKHGFLGHWQVLDGNIVLSGHSSDLSTIEDVIKRIFIEKRIPLEESQLCLLKSRSWLSFLDGLQGSVGSPKPVLLHEGNDVIIMDTPSSISMTQLKLIQFFDENKQEEKNIERSLRNLSPVTPPGMTEHSSQSESMVEASPQCDRPNGKARHSADPVEQSETGYDSYGQESKMTVIPPSSRGSSAGDRNIESSSSKNTTTQQNEKVWKNKFDLELKTPDTASATAYSVAEMVHPPARIQEDTIPNLKACQQRVLSNPAVMEHLCKDFEELEIFVDEEQRIVKLRAPEGIFLRSKNRVLTFITNVRERRIQLTPVQVKMYQQEDVVKWIQVTVIDKHGFLGHWQVLDGNIVLSGHSSDLSTIEDVIKRIFIEKRIPLEESQLCLLKSRSWLSFLDGLQGSVGSPKPVLLHEGNDVIIMDTPSSISMTQLKLIQFFDENKQEEKNIERSLRKLSPVTPPGMTEHSSQSESMVEASPQCDRPNGKARHSADPVEQSETGYDSYGQESKMTVIPPSSRGSSAGDRNIESSSSKNTTTQQNEKVWKNKFDLELKTPDTASATAYSVAEMVHPPARIQEDTIPNLKACQQRVLSNPAVMEHLCKDFEELEIFVDEEQRIVKLRAPEGIFLRSKNRVLTFITNVRERRIQLTPVQVKMYQQEDVVKWIQVTVIDKHGFLGHWQVLDGSIVLSGHSSDLSTIEDVIKRIFIEKRIPLEESQLCLLKSHSWLSFLDGLQGSVGSPKPVLLHEGNDVIIMDTPSSISMTQLKLIQFFDENKQEEKNIERSLRKLSPVTLPGMTEHSSQSESMVEASPQCDRPNGKARHSADPVEQSETGYDSYGQESKMTVIPPSSRGSSAGDRNFESSSSKNITTQQNEKVWKNKFDLELKTPDTASATAYSVAEMVHPPARIQEDTIPNLKACQQRVLSNPAVMEHLCKDFEELEIFVDEEQRIVKLRAPEGIFLRSKNRVLTFITNVRERRIQLTPVQVKMYQQEDVVKWIQVTVIDKHGFLGHWQVLDGNIVLSGHSSDLSTIEDVIKRIFIEKRIPLEESQLCLLKSRSWLSFLDGLQGSVGSPKPVLLHEGNDVIIMDTPSSISMTQLKLLQFFDENKQEEKNIERSLRKLSPVTPPRMTEHNSQSESMVEASPQCDRPNGKARHSADPVEQSETGYDSYGQESKMTVIPPSSRGSSAGDRNFESSSSKNITTQQNEKVWKNKFDLELKTPDTASATAYSDAEMVHPPARIQEDTIPNLKACQQRVLSNPVVMEHLCKDFEELEIFVDEEQRIVKLRAPEGIFLRSKNRVLTFITNVRERRIQLTPVQVKMYQQEDVVKWIQVTVIDKHGFLGHWQVLDGNIVLSGHSSDLSTIEDVIKRIFIEKRIPLEESQLCLLKSRSWLSFLDGLQGSVGSPKPVLLHEGNDVIIMDTPSSISMTQLKLIQFFDENKQEEKDIERSLRKLSPVTPPGMTEHSSQSESMVEASPQCDRPNGKARHSADPVEQSETGYDSYGQESKMTVIPPSSRGSSAGDRNIESSSSKNTTTQQNEKVWKNKFDLELKTPDTASATAYSVAEMVHPPARIQEDTIPNLKACQQRVLSNPAVMEHLCKDFEELEIFVDEEQRIVKLRAPEGIFLRSKNRVLTFITNVRERRIQLTPVQVKMYQQEDVVKWIQVTVIDKHGFLGHWQVLDGSIVLSGHSSDLSTIEDVIKRIFIEKKIPLEESQLCLLKSRSWLSFLDGLQGRVGSPKPVLLHEGNDVIIMDTPSNISMTQLKLIQFFDENKQEEKNIERSLRKLSPVTPPRMTEHNSQSESMVEASPQCDRPNGKARHSADPVEQSETGYDSYGQESKMTVIPPSSRGSSAGDRNFESSSSKNITTQQNEKVWKNKFDLELKTPDTASATAYSDAEMVHPPARIQEDTIPNLKACQQRVLSNPAVMEHLCKDFEELEIFVDEEQRIVKLRAPEGIFLRSKNRVLTFITNVRERRIQLTPVQVKMYQQEDVVKWIQVTVIDKHGFLGHWQVLDGSIVLSGHSSDLSTIEDVIKRIFIEKRIPLEESQLCLLKSRSWLSFLDGLQGSVGSPKPVLLHEGNDVIIMDTPSSISMTQLKLIQFFDENKQEEKNIERSLRKLSPVTLPGMTEHSSQSESMVEASPQCDRPNGKARHSADPVEQSETGYDSYGQESKMTVIPPSSRGSSAGDRNFESSSSKNITTQQNEKVWKNKFDLELKTPDTASATAYSVAEMVHPPARIQEDTIPNLKACQQRVLSNPAVMEHLCKDFEELEIFVDEEQRIVKLRAPEGIFLRSKNRVLTFITNVRERRIQLTPVQVKMYQQEDVVKWIQVTVIDKHGFLGHWQVLDGNIVLSGHSSDLSTIEDVIKRIFIEKRIPLEESQLCLLKSRSWLSFLDGLQGSVGSPKPVLLHEGNDVIIMDTPSSISMTQLKLIQFFDENKQEEKNIERSLRKLSPVTPPGMTEHSSQSESMVEASPQCDRPNGKARHSADPVEQSETGYDSYGQESKMTVIPPSSRGSSAGDRNIESSSSKNTTTQQNEKVWKNKFDLELKTPDTASATAYSVAEMVHPPARIQEDTIPNLKACQQRVLSNPAVMEHLCKDFEELEIFVDEEQRIVKLRAPEGIFLRSKNRVLTFITNVRERRIQLTPVQVKMYQQEDVVKWIQVTVIDKHGFLGHWQVLDGNIVLSGHSSDLSTIEDVIKRIFIEKKIPLEESQLCLLKSRSWLSFLDGLQGSVGSPKPVLLHEGNDVIIMDTPSNISMTQLKLIQFFDENKQEEKNIERSLRKLSPVTPPRMTKHNSQSESMVEASPQCDRPNGKARHSADPVEQSETGYDSYGQESKMTVIPPSSRGSSAGDRNFESSSSKNITTQQNEKVWKNKFDLELKTPDTASATAYSDAEMVHPPARIQEDTIPNLKACQQRVLSNPAVMEHLCKDFEELEIFVDEEQRIVKLRAPEGIFLRSKNRVLTFITNVRERRIQLTPVQVKMYQQEDVVKWIQVTVIDKHGFLGHWQVLDGSIVLSGHSSDLSTIEDVIKRIFIEKRIPLEESQLCLLKSRSWLSFLDGLQGSVGSPKPVLLHEGNDVIIMDTPSSISMTQLKLIQFFDENKQEEKNIERSLRKLSPVTLPGMTEHSSQSESMVEASPQCDRPNGKARHSADPVEQSETGYDSYGQESKMTVIPPSSRGSSAGDRNFESSSSKNITTQQNEKVWKNKFDLELKTPDTASATAYSVAEMVHPPARIQEDTIPNLKACQQRVLSNPAVMEHLCKDFEELEIFVDEEQRIVKLRAPEGIFLRSKNRVLTFITNVRERRIQLTPVQVKMYQQEDVVKWIQVTVIDKHGFLGHWQVLDGNIILSGHSSELSTIEDVIKRIFIEKKIPLEESQLCLLKSRSWLSFLDGLQENVGSPKPVLLHEGNEVIIMDTPSNISGTQLKLMQFFDKNKQEEKTLDIKQQCLKFLKEYCKESLTNIRKKAKENGVTIIFTRSSMVAKGPKDCLPGIVQEMKELLGRIQQDKMTFKKPGTAKYLRSTKGQECLMQVGTATRCLVTTDDGGIDHGASSDQWGGSNIANVQLDPEHELQIIQGDITKCTVDAIVNAANERLKHDGGVSYAIVKAGGQSIQKESDDLIKKYGNFNTGGVAVTRAGTLPCSHVIHAVGPMWSVLSKDKNERLLMETVRNVLKKAQDMNLTSVALPAISCGIYGFPIDKATDIILNTIDKFFRDKGNQSTLKTLVLIALNAEPISGFLSAAKALYGKSVQMKNSPKSARGWQSNPQQQETQIEHVQNPTLFHQYKVKKRDLELNNPKGTENEKRLFHGTTADSISGITTNGFNRSYCGVNGTALGAGVYFAANSATSVGYTKEVAKCFKLVSWLGSMYLATLA